MNDFTAAAEAHFAGPTTMLGVKEHVFHEGSLPKPVGWRLLVQPIDVEKTTEAGIILTDDTQEAKEYNRYVGKVLAVGEDAYKHSKFPGNAWCEVGDWVLYNQFTGMSATVKDTEGDDVQLRFVNDDAVLGIAPDPKALLIRV